MNKLILIALVLFLACQDPPEKEKITIEIESKNDTILKMADQALKLLIQKRQKDNCAIDSIQKLIARTSSKHERDKLRYELEIKEHEAKEDLYQEIQSGYDTYSSLKEDENLDIRDTFIYRKRYVDTTIYRTKIVKSDSIIYDTITVYDTVVVRKNKKRKKH